MLDSIDELPSCQEGNADPVHFSLLALRGLTSRRRGGPKRSFQLLNKITLKTEDLFH